MAAISRIVSIPSATQYNPIPPVLDEISYGGNYLETPSIRIDFDYPSQFWKNKPPFAYTSPYYREIVKRDSDGTVINDSPAFEGAGFTSQYMTAGTLCNYQSYTISNGSTVYSPVAYFTAQTRPDSPSSITLVSSDYLQIVVSWSDLSPTSKWGGAPSADREWRLRVEKWVNPTVGYGETMIDVTLGYAATGFTYGGYFDGQYRATLYSKTKAGLSSLFASTGAFFISPPPPFFPSFGGCVGCPGYCSCIGGDCLC